MTCGIRSKPEDKISVKNQSSAKIYVDTREQKPLDFENLNKQIKNLKFGDYAFSDRDSNTYIERKSVSDFIGTLSGGFDRFTREIERAGEAEAVGADGVSKKIKSF